jgi:uncharacterized protein YktB (UPF0637 family)
MHSQIPNTHKWEDRVLLLIAKDESSEIKEQIAKLLEKKQELLDRRLIIYTILEDRYRQIYSDHSEWVKNEELYKTYNPTNEAFKIILIGLDGSIKLNQNHSLTLERLFTIIDGMPMRKEEIKNKNK